MQQVKIELHVPDILGTPFFWGLNFGITLIPAVQIISK